MRSAFLVTCFVAIVLAGCRRGHGTGLRVDHFESPAWSVPVPSGYYPLVVDHAMLESQFPGAWQEFLDAGFIDADRKVSRDKFMRRRSPYFLVHFSPPRRGQGRPSR
jgi:hypothetical protein